MESFRDPVSKRLDTGLPCRKSKHINEFGISDSSADPLSKEVGGVTCLICSIPENFETDLRAVSKW